MTSEQVKSCLVRGFVSIIQDHKTFVKCWKLSDCVCDAVKVA